MPWKLCADHGSEQSECGGTLSARLGLGGVAGRSTVSRRALGRVRKRVSRDALRVARGCGSSLEMSLGRAHGEDEETSDGALVSSANWMWRCSGSADGTVVREGLRPRDARTLATSTGVKGAAEGLRERETEGIF